MNRITGRDPRGEVYRFGMGGIFRVGPGGIAIYASDEPLTDEILAASRIPEKRTGWVHYPPGRVRSVRVVVAEELLDESLLRFEFEMAEGRKTALVPRSDSPNLIAALKALLGDRFHDQTAAGRNTNPRRRLPARPVRRRPGTGKPPLRSPFLGWILKVIGLIYVVVIWKFDPIGQLNLHIVVLVPFYYVPGIAAILVGYRLCQRTFDPEQHPDARAPILFLRPFDDDDRLTYQATGFLAKVHGIFKHEDFGMPWSWLNVNISDCFRAEYWRRSPLWTLHPVKFFKLFFNRETYSSEELLSAVFRRRGPFVAIGSPGEKLATPGADRMYVSDLDWQRVVLDWMGRSQVVVLQPAQTEGVRWEIKQVFDRVPRHRVLLSLIRYHGKPNAYENFLASLATVCDVQLPLSVPFQKNPVFVYFEADGSPRIQPICYRSPLLWPFLGNTVDTARTFHAFLQGLDGAPRSLPLQPKRYPGHGTLSVMVLGVLLAGLMYLSTLMDDAISSVTPIVATLTKDLFKGPQDLEKPTIASSMFPSKSADPPPQIVLSQDDWMKHYQGQAPLLIWPAEVNRLQAWGPRWPEEVDRNRILATIIDYTIVYPESVTDVYKSFKPLDPIAGTGIVSAPPEQELLRPARLMPDDPPSLGTVWALQEKLWVQRNILETVARINGGAKDSDSAVIKRVDALSVGSPNFVVPRPGVTPAVLIPAREILSPFNDDRQRSLYPERPYVFKPVGGQGQYESIPVELSVQVAGLDAETLVDYFKKSPLVTEILHFQTRDQDFKPEASLIGPKNLKYFDIFMLCKVYNPPPGGR